MEDDPVSCHLSVLDLPVLGSVLRSKQCLVIGVVVVALAVGILSVVVVVEVLLDLGRFRGGGNKAGCVRQGRS